jgi:nitroreductase
MKRLGEILLDRGAIAIAELHTGLEACHYRGGRLGTQLLRFGFVDEHALLEALSEQLSVPPVTTTVLRRAPDPLRRMIPLNVALRLQAMVFDRRDGELSVAMTAPRNPAAIEEVISYVGLDIKPHVATEIGIMTALQDMKLEEQIEEAPAPMAGIATGGAGDQWQRLWTPPALQAADLLHPRTVAARDEIPMAATFPGLAPVPSSASGDARGPLDDTAFSILLRDARHRDEVGELLLLRVAAVLERSYLLAVHSGKIAGWLARGRGVVLDDVESFSAGADEPSALMTIAGGDSFCGRLPDGVINQLLIEMLGDPAPVEVVIIPISIKGRVVAYLVGDVPDSAVSRGDLEDLVTAAKKAGVALEILVMKRKFLTPPS